MPKRLYDEFLLPGASFPWGTSVSALGLEEPSLQGAWPRAPGVVELGGVALDDVTVGSCKRGPVRAVVYRAEDADGLRDVLEQALGSSSHVHRPHAAGSSWAVVDLYAWDPVRQVEVSLSVFGAPRDGSRAGLFVRCGDDRLAAPFLPGPAPPWGARGSSTPLGRSLIERPLSPAERVLDHPGVFAPAAWMQPGIWSSAGHWGVTDTTRATRIDDDARFVLHRLLPGRGAGGAFLEHIGVGTVMESSVTGGLDEVVEALRVRGVVVDVRETHDA